MSIDIGGLSKVMYRQIKDSDKSNEGWDKDIVRYTLEHQKELTRMIKSTLGTRGRNLGIEVEDTFNEFYISLYKAEDYNLNKAISASVNKGADAPIIGIEGYVRDRLNKFIKNAIMAKTSKNKKAPTSSLSELGKARNDSGSTGEEPDADIPDTKMSIELDNMISIEEACRSMEYRRYNRGLDIYLFIYMCLAANGMLGPISMFMKAIGIGDEANDKIKDDLTLGEESVFKTMIVAIERDGKLKSKREIRKYIYCADTIDSAFASINDPVNDDGRPGDGHNDDEGDNGKVKLDNGILTWIESLKD